MITKREAIGWRFLLKWIFATVFGFLVSAALGFMAPLIILIIGMSDDSGSALRDATLVAVILIALSAGILWITVGLAQWSILHRFMDQRAAGWVGATALAFLFITLIDLNVQQSGISVSSSGGLRLLLSASQGILLGMAQWFVLKKKVPQPALWIAVSLLSWTLAGLITDSLIPNRWEGSRSWILEFLVFGTLPVYFGTILSTMGLWWFLKQTIALSVKKANEEVITNAPTHSSS